MRWILAGIGLIASLGATSQHDEHDHLPCSVNIQAEQAYAANPSLRTVDSLNAIAFEAQYQNYLANEYDPFSRSSYVIPIVFHVVHLGGAENISDEQIYDALDKLNEDYAMMNSDLSSVVSSFQPVIGNPDIEFRLATRDPLGACHPGITRTYSSATVDDGSGQTMAAVAAEHGVWPQNRYLNIFVVSDPNGNAGYTNYPGSWYPANSMEGGIYLRHDYCGTIGTGSTSTRRTISHECAHWLNIRHVWGNSNNAGDSGNCGTDDLVTDTPNTLGNNGCDLSAQSCGDLDNVQNIMDYTGSCRRMFTQGQAARMHTALNNSTADRDNLWTSSNLIATGTDGPGDICVSQFSSDLKVVCAGQTVQYFDESYHSVTSRTWTFPGGTPSTSTAQNPIVTYTTGGVYDVTLQVSDGTASLSTTEPSYLIVQEDPGVSLPYSEGFETLTTLPDNVKWSIINENDDEAWELVNIGASGSSHCAGLMNFGNTDGTADELMSGTIDLSGVAASDPIVFDFEFAYRKRLEANNESLKFYISKDCGETWVLRKNISNTSLSPIATPTSFAPVQAAEWYSSSVTNINSDYYVSNFKYKFVFNNDGGNNIYIDNINLYPASMTSLAKESSELGLSVYPNPFTDVLHIQFGADVESLIDIELLDVSGREIVLSWAINGSAIDLSTGDLPNGVYFLNVHSENESKTVKVIKN